MANTRILSASALAFMIALLLPSSAPALADVPPVKWTKVSIPDQGDAGRWVLALGSDVTHLAIATDGTLYAAANSVATAQKLFKSTDNGTTWSPTGQVTATIVDLTIAPDNPTLVYYATSSSVYRSNNAGATFASFPSNPGGSGDNNVAITSIAVTGPPNGRTIAAATTDADPGQYGGVYTYDESQLFAAWQNTNIGACDVLAIASPSNYPSVRQLVAVTTNEINSVIATRIGPSAWGAVYGPTVIPNIAAVGASIAFPNDYGLNPDPSAVFVGLHTGMGAGDVYKIAFRPGETAAAVDLNAGASAGFNDIDVGALAVSGNSSAPFLVAGAAGSSSVFLSSDAGITWRKSIKGPTGEAVTAAVASLDNRFYAASRGIESAVSCSDDNATSWYQTGLIDTQITSSGLVDFAVSPNYSLDGTLFLLTWGGKHSLWRSRDRGASWQRVLSCALPSMDTFRMVTVSTSYGIADKALFVAGTAGGSQAIWKSSDGGEIFTQSYVPFAVDAWAGGDENTLFVAGYNGANALVCSTQNGGFFYSQPVPVGIQPLKSVVLSPDFGDDTTILAGNSVGKIFLSTDNGTTFRQLGQTLPLSGAGAGLVTVAFDPDFANSKRIFAATDAAATSTNRERIFTFVIDESDTWESIDGTLPVGGIINKIALAADGTLYAVNSKAVAAATSQGGLERSLAPSSTATFETITRGLPDGATLRGLWASDNRLWSLDTTNTRLMTFVDTLTNAPLLTSPQDGAGGTEINRLRLEWDGLSGATNYQWQLNDDDDFSDLLDGFGATTEDSSCRVPTLQLAVTYYWRVRATGPVKSPWSAKSSFTTKLGNVLIAPQLVNPTPGATGVESTPIFQWTSFEEAETYELLLGTEVAFNTLKTTKTGQTALPGTAWQSDVTLDYGSTYYWKVRAIGADSFSDWSNTGAFTVQTAPASATPAAVPPPATQVIQVTVPTPLITTNPLPDPGIPAWLLYAIGGVGLLLVGVLSAILIVLIRRR